jgi:hypothetical protein
VENYNFQSLHSQGTNTEDIINDHHHQYILQTTFQSSGEWTFGTISRDAQFTDNAKFRSVFAKQVVAMQINGLSRSQI